MGDRHYRQVKTAIRKGVCTSSATNSSVHYSGEPLWLLTLNGPEKFEGARGPRTLLTLDGPVHLNMRGEIAFYYYGVCVLHVDLEKKRLTDRGFWDFSRRTRSNIDEWLSALGLFIPRVHYHWHQWTQNWRKKRDLTEPTQDMLLHKFRRRAPWVRPDADQYALDDPLTWWFHWDKYDEGLANAFWQSKRFLAEPNNKRYFTYDWDEAAMFEKPLPIHWRRRFINDDAKRRWRNREKRNGRPWAHI